VRKYQDVKEKISEYEQEFYDKDSELQKLRNSMEDFKKQAPNQNSLRRVTPN
jgi:hypothetical protein